MQRALWTTIFAVIVGYPETGVAQQSATSSMEMTAARSTLSPYRATHVVVDSLFAMPGQAPPAMTARARPAARQRHMADALRPQPASGAADTLRIRASDPQIRGRTATVTVTVDGRASGGRPFYETVAYEFEYDGTRWQLRSRTQLGIS